MFRLFVRLLNSHCERSQALNGPKVQEMSEWHFKWITIDVSTLEYTLPVHLKGFDLSFCSGRCL